MGSMLLRHLKEAMKDEERLVREHKGFTDNLTPELTAEWENMCVKWELATYPKKDVPNPFKVKEEFVSEEQALNELAEAEQERVRAGGIQYHAVNAPDFITMSLALVDDQDKLSFLILEQKRHPTLRQARHLNDQRNALRKQLKTHMDIRSIYMPGLPHYLDQINQSEDVTEVEPENAKVWLPSDLPQALIPKICTHDVAAVEKKLQKARCHDSLKGVRHVLRVKTRMQGKKRRRRKKSALSMNQPSLSTSNSPVLSTTPSPIPSVPPSTSPSLLPSASASPLPATTSLPSTSSAPANPETKKRQKLKAQTSALLGAKHVQGTSSVKTRFDTERMTTETDGFLGLLSRVPDGDGQIYPLDDLVGPNSKYKFELRSIPSSSTSVPIVDSKETVIGVLLGPPRGDKSWSEDVAATAAKELENARDELFFEEKRLSHKRGEFPVQPYGYSFGGGQEYPKRIYHTPKNEDILRRLTSLPCFIRLAGHANGGFATWAPKVYNQFCDLDTRLRDKHPDCTRNFANSVWACTTYNFGLL
ncbi:hypothetical protein VNI00_016498 [Paramarasmius palmivorus]|uniref:Uncharacterized protein n=1 Tax=Paramarasmius palmivorus TaxID=297713 RepID=A0AAW0BDV0_9AGAR